ncbi:MAG: winged helix-turn-helix domain-containing protein [Nanoarchaeota archaeon]
MGERRDKLDIVSDILKSIQDKGGRIKPTHLLYKSNLSHEGMKRYIEELKVKLMIIEEEDPKKNLRYFIITDKGLKFLQDYKKIREFTDSFGL